MLREQCSQLNLFTAGAGFSAAGGIPTAGSRGTAVAAAPDQRRGDHGAREECRKNSSLLHFFDCSFRFGVLRDCIFSITF